MESDTDIWNMSLAQGSADAVRARVTHTGVGVLDRTMAVLDAVERGARSFTQIVEATGYTRSTTHRLVKALEEHGLLMTAGGRGYRLGPRLLGLALAAMRDLPLRDLAHPALERLARDTTESAQLYVREGDRRVCIDAVESTAELRTIVAVGASLPLTKGSAGKVLLAWAEDRDLGRLMATAVDPPDRPGLERQMAAARRRGWAASVGERETGVASVSAPVFDREGTLIAAVSVSGPANRIGTGGGKRYAPAVAAAAAQIQEALTNASG
jgi:DNA-binding IclR family transcriptional regulator